MKKSLPCEMKATTHTLFIGATLFIENFGTTQPTVSKYQKNVLEWLIALTFSSEIEMQGNVSSTGIIFHLCSHQCGSN